MPETARSHVLTRSASAVVAAMLALGAALMAPAAAHADGSSVPDGVYLDRPWTLAGGEVWLNFVGSTSECGDGLGGYDRSVSFVSSAGTYELEGAGFGEGYWIGRGYAFLDTGAPLPVGQSVPVSGQIVLACTPTGGGTTQTISMPFTVRPSAPSSIYHTSTAWTWFAPNTGAGAVVTINALGFAPGESVVLLLANGTKYSGTGSWTGNLAGPTTVTADGSGAVAAQVTVPGGWAPDDLLDVIAAGETSRYLLISGSGELSGEPSIAIASTDAAFPGSAVSVTAGGFDAGETVQIALHSALSAAVPLGTLTASASGVASGIVYLPSSQPAGSYRIWAGAKTIGYLLLNAPLDIAAAPTTARISGPDRFQTAVAISQNNFSTGVETVYLANGLNFPDALSAGALAAQLGAPVILTPPTVLPDPVRDELNRLQPARIVIVGGEPSVSAEVEGLVEDLPFVHETDRLAGANRFETNRLLIDDALGAAPVVYVSNGLNFPDALAAAPAAASKDGAVVLVNGAASSLDSATLSLLSGLGVVDVYITGNVASVSAGIQSQLDTLFPGHVTRLAGVDRFDTASRIVAEAWPTGAESAILANGLNFPDALAAGALGQPMLTSLPSCIPGVVLAQLGDLQPNDLTLVGDATALSSAVQNFTHC